MIPRLLVDSPRFAARPVALSVVVAASIFPGSPATGDDGRPNIVFLESDDHHYQALGCMGSPVKTPNIDRLAERGVLFRNNVCQGTACAPSRNSLVTGSGSTSFTPIRPPTPWRPTSTSMTGGTCAPPFPARTPTPPAAAGSRK